MSLPGMSMHTFDVLRLGTPTSTVDANRNPVRTGWTVLETGMRGTLGTPGWRDVQNAAQQDVAVTAVIATDGPTGVARGDRVRVLGETYRVEWVRHQPITKHKRVFLSAVEA